MPPTVVTNTLAAPAVPAGVVAVILVELTTVTLVAATPPMVTPVAPVKSVPVMVMTVPPAPDPVEGETLVTVGAGGILYKVLAVVVPPTVVTNTLAAPALPAGVVAVILVELTTVKLTAVPPMVTEVAPARSAPVMVMLVPPAPDPVEGETLVTVGAGGIVPLYSKAPMLGVVADRI